MPSVVVSPTRRPASLRMCAIIRAVVVFPFVPVTATIGTRLGAPRGKSSSITGRATSRGCPSVGWVCMRKPGPAFTSQIAPPASFTDWAMSGASRSMPATSRPITWAACAAMA